MNDRKFKYARKQINSRNREKKTTQTFPGLQFVISYSIIKYLICFVVHRTIFFSVYDGNDFYISENTTTFIEIPESCQLFGTQISEPISANKFALMTNETGRSVWVSAKLQFQKKVNPLGTLFVYYSFFFP